MLTGALYDLIFAVTWPQKASLYSLSGRDNDHSFSGTYQGPDALLGVLWFLKKGTLYLDIKFDTGTMNFYRGTAQ
jgi:hypothetical protein